MLMPDGAVPVLLWVCTALLMLRVAGQLVVVLRAPRWLPPNEQWMSGLVPYRWLLPAQIIVLALMTWMSADVTRRAGLFGESSPAWGAFDLAAALIYFAAMVVRYVVRMVRRPDQRWFGGTIPIVFHSVVAAFLGIFALYHLSSSPPVH
jgi:hypothetical protein